MSIKANKTRPKHTYIIAANPEKLIISKYGVNSTYLIYEKFLPKDFIQLFR